MYKFKTKRQSLREVNWNSINPFFQPNLLIKRIELDTNSKLSVEKIDWYDYWKELLNFPQKLDFSSYINTLYRLRLERFSNLSDISITKEYCRAYFEILHKIVNVEYSESFQKHVLRALIEFETIPIFFKNKEFPALVAIDTSTNPAYLLSRIRQPVPWDNPRFLPLVSYNLTDDETNINPLFYQYRRISGGVRQTTLFTYIPVDKRYRQESFIAWQQFANSLTSKKDTIIKTRAKCISKSIIEPLVSNIPGYNESPEKTIRIVDLGGGSGDLTKWIIENLLSANSIIAPKIDLTVVDLDFPDMTRHIKNTRFYKSLVSLKCYRIPFIDWVFKKTNNLPKVEFEIKHNISEIQKTKKYDFIFLFRLLNNLSKFSIEWCNGWSNIRKIVCEKISESEWQAGEFFPHNAIQTNQMDKIVLSVKQILLNQGTTFCLASLTDYFRALFLLSYERDKEKSVSENHNTIYFPVRKLNLDTIFPKEKTNFFQKLCRLCHYVLVEDIDLNSMDLQEYFNRNGLSQLKIQNLPSKIPFSHSFCIFEDHSE